MGSGAFKEFERCASIAIYPESYQPRLVRQSVHEHESSAKVLSSV
jgi:hypothetical protein